MKSHRTKVIAAAAGLLAASGAGAAIAGTSPFSASEESQAILSDVAEELDVTPSALREALEDALSNRVDAAVAAGRLTEADGAELKSRIEAGELPLLGVPHAGRGPFGHFRLDAAADYLGMTEAELRSALGAGQTLAEVAQAHDRSVEGLIQAMVDAAIERLDEAVAEGRLTEAQKQSLVSGLRDRITDLVNATIGPRVDGAGALRVPSGGSAA